MKPMTFVDWEYGIDLRDIRWNKRHITRIQREYKLQHGQAVIFFNNAKEFGGNGNHPPKSRIYWCWGGEIVVVIPMVDEGRSQLSYQLRLNEWLRKNFSCPEDLQSATHTFDTNIERRKAASAAAKRRKERE